MDSAGDDHVAAVANKMDQAEIGVVAVQPSDRVFAGSGIGRELLTIDGFARSVTGGSGDGVEDVVEERGVVVSG